MGVFGRELALGDLGRLGEPQAKPALQRLRDSHHAVARALAQGMPAVEASALTGYTPTRIGQLQADPAFQELLNHYRLQVDSAFAETQQRLAQLGLDAVGELQSRLDESPEEIKTRELIEMVAMTRGGGGGQAPSGASAPVTVNISFAEPQGQVIEGGAVEGAEGARVIDV